MTGVEPRACKIVSPPLYGTTVVAAPAQWQATDKYSSKLIGVHCPTDAARKSTAHCPLHVRQQGKIHMDVNDEVASESRRVGKVGFGSEELTSAATSRGIKPIGVLNGPSNGDWRRPAVSDWSQWTFKDRLARNLQKRCRRSTVIGSRECSVWRRSSCSPAVRNRVISVDRINRSRRYWSAKSQAATHAFVVFVDRSNEQNRSRITLPKVSFWNARCAKIRWRPIDKAPSKIWRLTAFVAWNSINWRG
jgi:hypothetical protein